MWSYHVHLYHIISHNLNYYKTKYLNKYIVSNFNTKKILWWFKYVYIKKLNNNNMGKKKGSLT